MARAKLSPIVTEISGSIGGVTIQRNKFGVTLRQKPLPANPASVGQYNVRKNIVIIQKAWQALTDAQRLQWNRFSDFSGVGIKRDRSVKMSGHSLYLKYQMLRLLMDRPLLTTISYVPLPDLALFDHIEANPPLMWLYFDSVIISSEYWYLFRVTSPRLPTKKFSPRGLRVIPTTYNASASFNIGTNYVNAFGAAAAIGDTVHWSLQYFNYVSPVISGIYTGTAVIQSI